MLHPINIYPKDACEQRGCIYLQATHKDSCLCTVFPSEPEVLKQGLKDKDEPGRTVCGKPWISVREWEVLGIANLPPYASIILILSL